MGADCPSVGVASLIVATPARADITVDTSFGTVLGSASFDVNDDGVLSQPTETDSPGTVNGNASPSFTGNSTGQIGGATGSGIENATVDAPATRSPPP